MSKKIKSVCIYGIGGVGGYFGGKIAHKISKGSCSTYRSILLAEENI
ncbi:MAG: hypothetical protein IBV53_08425 [Candidatus Atribacteria bacterium]